MVAAQLGCSDNYALAVIKERAVAVDLSVEEIALAIVEGHIRLGRG